MKNKKIMTFAATLALYVSGLAGVVSAANTTDSAWSFYNQNETGSTASRQKYNNTNVYIYPKVGQNLEYTVQKQVANSADYTTLRPYVKIPINKQATLRSSAGNLDVVRVGFYNPNTQSYGYTTGVWSPDSTQYYTVY